MKEKNLCGRSLDHARGGVGWVPSIFPLFRSQQHLDSLCYLHLRLRALWQLAPKLGISLATGYRGKISSPHLWNTDWEAPEDLWKGLTTCSPHLPRHPPLFRNTSHFLNCQKPNIEPINPFCITASLGPFTKGFHLD